MKFFDVLWFRKNPIQIGDSNSELGNLINCSYASIIIYVVYQVNPIISGMI